MKCCKNCGVELSEGMKFCSLCGEKVEQEERTPVSVSIIKKVIAWQEPWYKIWWFWLLVALFCFSMISIVWIGVTSGGQSTGEQSNIGDESDSYEIGGKNNPYVLSADTWYVEHCEESTQAKYLNKWVKVTGTVLNISGYTNREGYYLAGGPENGLVCWVTSISNPVDYGQIIEYVGKVTTIDSTKIELTDGNVKCVKWPDVPPLSPITISNWSASRNSVGGVEWNFKLTNNTDKVVKYVTLEWNCYNSVGDLVYDQITGKSSYSIKYTGPLESGKTTTLLRNTTLFYSYSYKTAALTKMRVEFMDGTIVYVSTQGYTGVIID